MKTAMIDKKELVSLVKQCKILGLSRSTIYYKPQISEKNLNLMNKIDELYMEDPTRGTRRMKAALRNVYSIFIGRAKIRSLMRRMGISAIYPKKNLSKANKKHKIYPYLLRNVKITHCNHVWSTDITYVRLEHGFVYLIAVIDWYSRYVLSWRLSNTLDTSFCTEVLNEAIATYGKPEIFNTDQGSQFTSEDFIKILEDNSIDISMDGKGRALDNVFVERLWRTVKYEDIYIRGYRNQKECYIGLKNFFERYNFRREHSSLDYKYPAQIYLGEKVLEKVA